MLVMGWQGASAHAAERLFLRDADGSVAAWPAVTLLIDPTGTLSAEAVLQQIG